ncbi:hypothetical protein BB558_002732 [Smittium angustum]|uniref:Cytochrome P450 n=1 Tax=Smittium angustum TaxID=133377 RepID=A0A2U1J7V0_SMIAN|nr:hypothetical protein BB558_002732 [Smittium angustum]
MEYLLFTLFQRLFLNPLNKIPGPWWARLTSLPYRISIATGDTINASKKIHDKYGPIARVAPGEVSVADTFSIKKMLSSFRYKKSKKYGVAKVFHESIFSTSDETFNKMRRRQVAPAYSHAGLDTVEDVIMENGIISLKKYLDSEIEKGNGVSTISYINAFQNLTSDVIGSLTFGKSFNAMGNNGHPLVAAVDKGRMLTVVNLVFPIVSDILGVFPSAKKAKSMIIDYSVNAMDERKLAIEKGSYKTEKTDILQIYMDAVNTTNGKKLSKEELIDELIVTLIGGTDTTSMTMTWLLHVYLLYPQIYKKVCDEVLEQFPDRSKPIRYHEARQKLPYLVASVYECMRLRAVSGSVFFRETPAEGVELCGYNIPKGVDVALFFEGAHHDPKMWENPQSFNPDRFMGPEGEKMKKEVLVFSMGVRICPGKNLAWYEILTVIPNLIRDYDISLPEGSIYTSDNLDPTRNNEPMFIEDIDWNPRKPRYETRDCNIVIKHRNLD